MRVRNIEPNEDDLAALGLAPSLEAVQQSVDAAWANSETKQQDMDADWANLARTRLEELKIGAVKGVSWQDIKNDLR